MIISHKHKFIFIKTKKTASTSTEIALSEICGPDDIITPISTPDELYRKELGFPCAQNFELPLKQYSKKQLLDRVLKNKKVQFFNHINANRVRSLIPNDIWNEYYKFTFERNPFDKLISWYYWCGGEEKYPTITDFINSGRAAALKGFDLYTLNNEIIVDHVYKLEEMDKSLKDISEKLGLKEAIQLPPKKTKGNIRKPKSDYKKLFNKDNREWAEKVFSREIAYFSYKF